MVELEAAVVKVGAVGQLRVTGQQHGEDVKGGGGDVKGRGGDVKGCGGDGKGCGGDVKGRGEDVKGRGWDVKGYIGDVIYLEDGQVLQNVVLDARHVLRLDPVLGVWRGC
eukprot:207046-Prorocentrum_minimum.AAC.1